MSRFTEDNFKNAFVLYFKISNVRTVDSQITIFLLVCLFINQKAKRFDLNIFPVQFIQNMPGMPISGPAPGFVVHNDFVSKCN